MTDTVVIGVALLVAGLAAVALVGTAVLAVAHWFEEWRWRRDQERARRRLVEVREERAAECGAAFASAVAEYVQWVADLPVFTDTRRMAL